MTTVEPHRPYQDRAREPDATFAVVDPVATAADASSAAAPALEVRADLHVALLSNGKVNGTELLEAVARHLSGLLPPGATFRHYRKPSVSVAPDAEDVESITRTADAVICAIGDCGSCSSRTLRDAIEMEWAGLPSAAIIADALVAPVDAMRRTSGMPDYPFCVTPFPVGNLTPVETDERGRALAPEVLELLTTGRPERSAAAPGPPTPGPPAAARPGLAARYRFGDDGSAAEACFELGWTDGLPVVPPTEDRVAEMLDGLDRPPGDVVFRVPTRNGLTATVELAAANAVMAGCRPEHLPVVLAALDALGSPGSNAHGHTGTMAGSQQVLVVNGPVRHRLGINSGEGALGPGRRANAVIGRALRLVVRNVMRSLPGGFDRAAFGHPGRWSWCFGEAEEESPWSPLAVEMGRDLGEDAVSLYATSWQASTICHSRDAEELLDEIALAARTACHVNWLHSDVATESSFHATRPFLWVTGHEHARVLASGGYSDKRALQDALFDRLTGEHPDLLPVAVASPERVHFVYVHGTGMQQTWFFAPFQSHRLVTRPVAAGVTPAAGGRDADLRHALDGLRTSLAADDYRLDAAVEAGAVRVRVEAGPEACGECLVPEPMMEKIIRDALAGTDLAGLPVNISLP